ncbi:MAG TPA: transcriptional regulator [Brevundimonas sp.]|nr:transcriptional regulator [Brevundimonas sp.]
MISLLTPPRAKEMLAQNLKQRRLELGLTQAGLAARAGVALGTLRKFEQTGAGSTETLIRVLGVVGGLDAVIKATEPDTPAFASIDEVLKPQAASRRKHGWRS